MRVTDEQISSIVDKVVAGMAGHSVKQVMANSEKTTIPEPLVNTPTGFLGCFPDVDASTLAAKKAFQEFRFTPFEKRKKIIAAIRKICIENVEKISKMALEETGLGRWEDKVIKNTLAIEKTPGVEDLEAICATGDYGLMMEEACPFGVIGSITPTTNPTETIINNGIGMIAGGNTVAFHPHPSAKNVCAYTIHLMNKAALSEGGPPNLFTTVQNPTIESAGILMKHKNIRVLVVTGGPAVVNAAMKSGKRVFAAGPGNPPVVVDETADIDKAAHDIVLSASCDNNIICIIEKEIIVVESVADQLKKALVKHGSVELGEHQTRRLKNVLFDENNHTRKQFVGKDIQVILKEIGMNVDPSKRMAICETGPDHLFATTELLMPVLPLIRVKDVDEAIDLAFKLEKGCGHTAVIHSKNIDNMHKMAVKMNTSLFIKNGPALAGLGYQGEGYTSFTITSPTGEGLTSARNFCRIRRCTLQGHFGNL